MRTGHAVLFALMLGASNAYAQVTAPPMRTAATTPREGTPAYPWTFELLANMYWLPDARDFAMPMLSADRGRLRLEARYNYEALETGSFWVGVNFAGMQAVSWAITPMVGVALGATPGVAPGYKGSLNWRRLELYSEGEYFLDAGDSSASFFYNWSEFSVAPVEWFRVGVVGQRTRAYASDRDFERGLLAGMSYKRADVTAYVFNPDDSKSVFVLGVSVSY